MRIFPFDLPSDEAIKDDDPHYHRRKWERAHEKKRLAAYLKGKRVFAHGRDQHGENIYFPVFR